MEHKLDPRKFLRIHRATLLNVDYIHELHSWFAGRMMVRLKDEKRTELGVSRDRVRALKERLGSSTMERQNHIKVEQYLRTSYSPDRDYVDGRVLERLWGDKAHATAQGNLVDFFGKRRKELNIGVLPELRVQGSPARFRIPDVGVVKRPVPDEQVFTTPPFLCVEILSRDDTMQYIQEKIDEYLNFGVPNIWMIDPKNRN